MGSKLVEALSRTGVKITPSWHKSLAKAAHEGNFSLKTSKNFAYFLLLFKGDVMVTDMLITNCVDDIKMLGEPWPLHIAAKYG